MLEFWSKWVKRGQNDVKRGQNDSKWPKVGSKWVKTGQRRSKWLKTGPNGPQQSDTVKGNENCDQIPRRGTADGIDLRPLGRQWPNWSLKAPFAAKFGMILGVLTVFSGPVHSRGAQRESKWLKTGSKWLKVDPKRPKMAQNGSK